MKQLLFIAFFAALVSCRKDPSLWETENLNNNTIAAFGHGGMGISFKYPINSYESLEPCLRIGADGAEMDVQMTRDSVLVLFHNPLMEEGCSCSGILNGKNWEEIKDCLYSSPYSNNVHIIPVSYLLDRADLKDQTFTFDCKLYESQREEYRQFMHTYANALIRLVNAYNIRQKVLVENPDTNFLRILKTRAPEIKLFIYPENFSEGLAMANKMDLYGITIANSEITAGQVKLAHASNRRVTVWNVKTEDDNLDAISKSVDYIQSDKLEHLLKIQDKYKKQGVKSLRW